MNRKKMFSCYSELNTHIGILKLIICYYYEQNGITPILYRLGYLYIPIKMLISNYLPTELVTNLQYDQILRRAYYYNKIYHTDSRLINSSRI